MIHIIIPYYIQNIRYQTELDKYNAPICDKFLNIEQTPKVFKPIKKYEEEIKVEENPEKEIKVVDDEENPEKEIVFSVKKWTDEEDEYLKNAINIEGTVWKTIYLNYPKFKEWNRSENSLINRWKRIQKISEKPAPTPKPAPKVSTPLKKSSCLIWTEEQDNYLKKIVKKEGTQWKKICENYPKFCKWNRTAKSLLKRWAIIDDEVKETVKNLVKWTKEEDNSLEEAVKKYGTAWTTIVEKYPIFKTFKRSKQSLKCRWNRLQEE